MKKRSLGAVTLDRLRREGAFVRPTGKRGRPPKSFGDRNRLHVKAALDVQRLVDADKGRPYDRNMRAFKIVAQQQRMAVQTVKTHWKRASRAELTLRLGVAEIESWFALLPEDVRAILGRLSVGDLLRLLRTQGIDRCTSADFCAAVRRDLSPPI